mmetsp:Transcript_36389/g.35272  ORF Transcript_36389/g.35272 Transcript_36389/m.35272 type:complete len:124 (+) Transcript_36389:290-661(+)
MMINLLRDHRIPLINIVRREEQVQLLKEEYKCEHVLNSSNEDFPERLKELTKELEASVVLECVSGPIVGQIVDALPKNGIIITYGQLSEEKMSGISPLMFMGKNLTIEGFLLPYWMKEQSYWT